MRFLLFMLLGNIPDDVNSKIESWNVGYKLSDESRDACFLEVIIAILCNNWCHDQDNKNNNSNCEENKEEIADSELVMEYFEIWKRCLAMSRECMTEKV